MMVVAIFVKDLRYQVNPLQIVIWPNIALRIRWHEPKTYDSALSSSLDPSKFSRTVRLLLPSCVCKTGSVLLEFKLMAAFFIE